MPSGYNRIVAGGGEDGDTNIASFDLEITFAGSGGQRSGVISKIVRNLVICFFVASVVLAGYCVYTGTVDLPQVLIGKPQDVSNTDGPYRDGFAGMIDDDWGPEKEIEQSTKQQNEEVVTEPQHNEQQQSVENVPKHIFCYGDSLTFGWVPNEHEQHPYGPFLESELNQLYSSESLHPPAAIVQSLGFPGMTASEMYSLRFQEQVGTCFIANEDPNLSVIIILAGTNDVGRLTQESLSQEETSTNNIAEKILESITNLHKATLDCAKKAGNKDLHILSLGIPGSVFQKRSSAASRIVAAVNKGLNDFSTRYNVHSLQGKIVYSAFPFSYDGLDSKWSQDGLHLSKTGYEELGKALAPEVKKILDMMNHD